MASTNAALLEQLPKDCGSTWDFFFQLADVPHGSHNLEKIIPFYKEKLAEMKAKHPALEYELDEASNIYIRLPATKGYEQVPGIILQSHSDMVAVKTATSTHDFTKDPLKLRIVDRDGKKVLMATETTLGADDGMGEALSWAILEEAAAEVFPHGPLEVVITSNEEVGLLGAQAIPKGILKGKYLINVDSEDPGICISCAGGFRVEFSREVKREALPTGDWESWALNLQSFNGGHSGCDIHLYRANAIKLLARLISRLQAEVPQLRLAAITGGTTHNAIPGFASSVIAAPKGALTEEKVRAVFAEVRGPYGVTDPKGELLVSQGADLAGSQPLTPCETARLLRFLLVVPHGPERFSPVMKDLVETSFAITVVKMAATDAEFTALGSGRSSVESELDLVYEKLSALAALSEFKISPQLHRYPGWPANPDSPLLKIMSKAHKDVLGSEPLICAIHAGLEAGLITEKHPGMDAVSIGPTIKNPHSPDEYVEIDTVSQMYAFLKESVMRMAACK